MLSLKFYLFLKCRLHYNYFNARRNLLSDPRSYEREQSFKHDFLGFKLLMREWKKSHINRSHPSAGTKRKKNMTHTKQTNKQTNKKLIKKQQQQ